LFMIPSGAPMDAMIDAVMPLLDEGDTIIDGGNADFHDTRRRAAAFEGTGRHFVGMGVSGGEEGARHGPSMMVGGTDHSWTQLRPMLSAIAAKFQGAPCVDHLGPDGAGHFVKTVHNGIEYADMQMIAEVYGLLRDAGGQTAPQIGALFESWQKGPLSSYLIEVSAAALQTVDAESGTPMVDLILDKAGQKGTGRWTLIEALKLGQSASSIEAAVGARGWSSEKALRVAAAPLLPDAVTGGTLPTEEEMKSALRAARILGHAQGFRVLSAASDEFGWQLDMARIAEIWRAGCIIRSALLDDLADAFHAGLPEGALILAPAIRDMLADNAFGEAGSRVVIEEFLEGEEASFIVIADGEHVLPMATSQDHKRVGEGDTGLNTGGMGAYAPAAVVNESIMEIVHKDIIGPTLACAAGTTSR